MQNPAIVISSKKGSKGKLRGKSFDEDDSFLITKSVLARKSLMVRMKRSSGSGGERGVVDEIDGEGVVGEIEVNQPISISIEQPILNQYIEVGIIIVTLLFTLMKENLNDYLIWIQLSLFTFLKSTLNNKKGIVDFPQHVHLWAFPVILSFTCGPEYTQWLNQMLSLTSLTTDSFDNILIEILMMIRFAPSDYVVSPLELHKEVMLVVSLVCGISLTNSEISLFSSLLINLMYLRGSGIGGVEVGRVGSSIDENYFTDALFNGNIHNENNMINTFIQGIILSPFLAVVLSYPFLSKVINLSKIIGSHRRPKNSNSLKLFYANIIYFTFPLESLAILGLYLQVNKSDLYSFLEYIFNETHLYMLGYWSTILIITLPIVIRFSTNWLLDLRRKVWHLCIVLMFLPVGCNIDASFTSISMTIALVLFLISEIIRATTLPPFGQKLHQILINYTDHRDTHGPIIISHIFLLLGIYLPIAFCSSPIGIICLGLGDSSASTIGRRYGKYKIFGKKTLEGTLSFVIGVCIGLYTCTRIPSYSMALTIYQIFIIGGTTALLEAVSGMNDNVIVPLYMLVIYQLIK